MARDELRQPLRKRSLKERLWAKRPGALALASGLAVAGFVSGGIWLSRLPYPMAGEPVVSMIIPPVEVVKETASTTPAPDTADADDTATGDTSQPDDAAVTETVPAIDPSSYQEASSIIVVGKRPLKAAPIASVSEKSADGPLPRIGAGGKRPSDVYAQTVPIAYTSIDQPKIAIMLGGMGLNAKLTTQATNDLPADITFGFAPYGDDLQTQVNRARAQGHEVMLQLPMEPVGYPGNNPGPNTLVTASGDADNLKALRWNMSRFAGYTGVVNYMGTRFLADAKSLQPVMQELNARGLLFLEDQGSAVSTALVTAKATGVKFAKAQLVIDADPDPAAITARLGELEAAAKQNGIAVGTGAGLDVTIDAVADWAKQLQSKGIVLVPISAVYRGRMS
ncbi:divergent polysaccharide deacetylase family protein [Aestuariivirga sp.]|uniref:divergent polysaccharide deacetylase family protein n=1 Tax=Aestuariivirga sp. TaxID=2650926 RepID=UPI0039E556A9